MFRHPIFLFHFFLSIEISIFTCIKNLSMDCYNCIHRGTVPGSCHSSCRVLRLGTTDDSKTAVLESLVAIGSIKITLKEDQEAVKLNEHGVKNGWANWPLDFDPIWVDECVFYTKKEEEKVGE